MPRRAREDGREALLRYLNRAPEFNLFIIGDVQRHGMMVKFRERMKP